MAKKKHAFHCAKCNGECMIYRKGKKHRVFVCPNCGVLATNPIHLGGIVGKVAKVARTLPFGETIGTGLEELGVIEKGEPSKAAGVSAPHYHAPRADRVVQALALR